MSSKSLRFNNANYQKMQFVSTYQNYYSDVDDPESQQYFGVCYIIQSNKHRYVQHTDCGKVLRQQPFFEYWVNSEIIYYCITNHLECD